MPVGITATEFGSFPLWLFYPNNSHWSALMWWDNLVSLLLNMNPVNLYNSLYNMG